MLLANNILIGYQYETLTINNTCFFVFESSNFNLLYNDNCLSPITCYVSYYYHVYVCNKISFLKLHV